MRGRFPSGRKRYRKTQGVKAHYKTTGEYATTSGPPVQTGIWIVSNTTPAETVGPLACVAILRKLAGKAGMFFRSHHDFIFPSDATSTKSGTWELAWWKSANGNPQISRRSITPAVTDTWGTLADAWWTDIKAGFGAGDIVVNKVAILRAPTAGVTADSGLFTPLAQLDLTQATLAFRATDVLRLQNRTGADLGIEREATNIDANPLEGKIYHINRSTMLPGWTNDDAVTPTFVPDATTGLVTINPQDSTLSNGLANVLKRAPHQSSIQKCYKAAYVQLGPGHIKESRIIYNFRGKLQVFINEILNVAIGSFNTSTWGRCQALFFEKAMRTDSGTAQVTIGYEKHLYMNCQLYCKSGESYVTEQL